MEVNKKTRLRVTADLRPQIADGLRAARKALGLTQTALAEALGSSQGAVTRWERKIDSPPISAFLVLAELVPEEQRAFWIELAGGSPSEEEAVTSHLRSIPVLRDAAAAGTPRIIEEKEIDYTLLFPPHLLPAGGKLVGIKVYGDSMAPILETGYVALIDIAQRQATKLVDKMVAVREGDGVTLKWLRKQEDLYLLVPQNTSPRHPVRIMKAEGDWSIIGEVVKWIGTPRPVKRK